MGCLAHTKVNKIILLTLLTVGFMRILLKKYRLFFGGCFFLAVIMAWAQQVLQPIQYNHKIHIDEAGLECVDCHQNVETQSRALIPNINVCSDCHDDDTEDTELLKVAEYIENGLRIPWLQVHSVPDYAFFSHRRHVVLGQIECTSCHGDVAGMEKPFTTKQTLMDMDWCIDCHEKQQVNNDCYACHR